MNIGIIGYGFVGKAVEYGFGIAPIVPHEIYIYDKYKEGLEDLDTVLDKSEVIFICLPTPFDDEELEIDLTIMDDMIEEIVPKIEDKGKVLVIKSTVVPGTTRSYSQMYDHCVPFVFNPEFLTEANYLNDFVEPDRIVVGADNDWARQKVIDLYRSIDPDTPIYTMSPTAAEIVKYQSNVLMATKVVVSNVFYDMCEVSNVEYNDVKEAVGADHRIGPSHLNVTSERGFGGKCFPKDLGAFIGECRRDNVDCKLLEEVYEYNLRIRRVQDWKEIAGATVGGRDYE